LRFFKFERDGRLWDEMVDEWFSLSHNLPCHYLSHNLPSHLSHNLPSLILIRYLVNELAMMGIKININLSWKRDDMRWEERELLNKKHYKINQTNKNILNSFFLLPIKENFFYFLIFPSCLSFSPIYFDFLFISVSPSLSHHQPSHFSHLSS